MPAPVFLSHLIERNARGLEGRCAVARLVFVQSGVLSSYGFGDVEIESGGTT